MGSDKTLNIIKTFVGQVVTCAITVAEPDGTNPETRTATYNKVIEELGVINTPSVLGPQDGAGSGDARYLLSDTIIDVEGGGISTCETELISNVNQDTTIRLSFVVQKGTTSGGIGVDPDCTKLDGDGLQWIETRAADYAYDTNFDSHPGLADGDYVWPIFEINGLKQFTVTTSFSTGYADYRVARFSDDGINWGPVVIDNGDATVSQRFTFDNPDGAKYMAFGYSNTVTPATQVWGLTGVHPVELTFPSDQGFDCFEPGTVVQGTDVKVGDTYDFKYRLNVDHPSSTPIAYGEVGDVNETQEYGKPLTSTQQTTFMYFDCGKQLKNVVFVRYSGYSETGTEKILYGSNDATNPSAWVELVRSFKISNPSDQQDAPAFTNGDTFYRYFCLAAPTAASGGLSHNKFGIDEAVFTEQVKVISKDEDANTITVDGGEWFGSDTYEVSQVWDKYLTCPDGFWHVRR